MRLPRTSAEAQHGEARIVRTERLCAELRRGSVGLILKWPAEEVEAQAAIQPRRNAATLSALQDANAAAADMLATSCPADEAATPPSRLAAAGKRLDAMLEAVKLVRCRAG